MRDDNSTSLRPGRWSWLFALVLFVAVDALMVPSIADERVRVPGDMVPHFPALGNVGGPPPAPVHNGILSDWMSQFSWWQVAVREGWLAGRVPLWNERSGAGMPLAANLQSEAFSPFLPLNLIGGEQYADWRQFAQLLLAQMLSLLLARRIGLGMGAGVVIGLSYSVVGYYMQVWAVHPLSASAAFAPGVLSAFLGLRARWRWSAVVGAGGGLAASILAGHVETAFKIGLLSGMVGLFWWPSRSRPVDLLRYLGGVALSGGLCFGLSAVLLLPFLELMEHSTLAVIRQGNSVILHDSMHLATLVDANALGSPVRGLPAYRGGFNYNEGAYFLGRTALLLAGLGLLLVGAARRRLAIALALTAGLAALVIHGPGSLAETLARLPVFDAMVTTRLGYLMVLPVAVLAGFGFEALAGRRRADVARALAITLGTALVVAIVVAVSSETPDRIRLSLIGGGLSLVTAGALIGAAGQGRRARALRWIVIVLLVVEGAWTWRDFVPLTTRDEIMPPAPALRTLEEVAKGDRTLIPLAAPTALAERYGIRRVRRYDPIVMRRLELMFWRPTAPGTGPDAAMPHAPPAVLDALAVRWLLTTSDPAGWVRPLWTRTLAPGGSIEIPVDAPMLLGLRASKSVLAGGFVRVGSRGVPTAMVPLHEGAALPAGIASIRDEDFGRHARFVRRGAAARFLRAKAATGGVRLELASGASAPVLIEGLVRGAFGPTAPSRPAGALRVSERRGVLPPVHQAARLRRAKDQDEAAALLRHPDFDPRRTTIYEGEEIDPGSSPEAAVAVAHRRLGPERLDFELGHDRGGFVVVAESWAPGWRAFSGDRELEVRPANLGTYGVIVPPGVRKVSFVYRPPRFVLGVGISLATLLLLAATAFWRWRRAGRSF